MAGDLWGFETKTKKARRIFIRAHTHTHSDTDGGRNERRAFVSARTVKQSACISQKEASERASRERKIVDHEVGQMARVFEVRLVLTCVDALIGPRLAWLG